MLHVEDIRNYIHCKIESIDDEVIHEDFGKMCRIDLSLKLEYVHIENFNLVKYMFYTKFDNQIRLELF